MVNEVVNEAIAESVLEIETDSAVAITSKTDGFYKDEVIKILLLQFYLIAGLISYNRLFYLLIFSI